MTDKLTKMTREETIAMNPAFGFIGPIFEWRRCGSPSDGYSRGIAIRFADTGEWYKLEGTIKENTQFDWVWSDGSPIVRTA